MAASVVYSNEFHSGFSGPSFNFTPTGAAVDDVILFTAEVANTGNVVKPAAWTQIYTQSGFVGFYGGHTRVWGYKMQASDFTSGTPNAITISTAAYQNYCATVHVVRGLSGVPTTYTVTGPSTTSTTPIVVPAQTASAAAPKLLVFAASSPSTTITSINFDAVTLSPQGVQQSAHIIRAGVIDQNTSNTNTTNSPSSNRTDYVIVAVDLVLASSSTDGSVAGVAATASAAAGVPTVSGVRQATVAAVAAVATAVCLAPTVTGSSNATVPAATAAATAVALVPSVSTASGSTVLAPAATATAAALAPTVTGSATVTVTLATATGAAYAPTVSTTASPTVAAARATATASMRVPVVQAIAPQVAVDTPPERTLTIDAAARVLTIDTEDRTLRVSR